MKHTLTLYLHLCSESKQEIPEFLQEHMPDDPTTIDWHDGTDDESDDGLGGGFGGDAGGFDVDAGGFGGGGNDSGFSGGGFSVDADDKVAAW
jgi:ATP-dependent RNA helicase DDX3X